MNLEKMLNSVAPKPMTQIITRSDYLARMDVLNTILGNARMHILHTHSDFIELHMPRVRTLKEVYSRLKTLKYDENISISREAKILYDHFIKAQCAHANIAQLNQIVVRSINYNAIW